MNPKELISQIKDYADIADASMLCCNMFGKI